jgi:hypothetical protein
MNKSTFTLNRKKLHAELLSIKRIAPKFFKDGIVQINVLPMQIEVHVIGVTKYLPAITEGYFDIMIPLRLLYAYTSTNKDIDIKFEVKQHELKCGDSLFSHPEIKLTNIFDTNIEELPLNYDNFDLLRYAIKANDRELANMGLTGRVKAAKMNLNTAIVEASSILSSYRITYQDLETLIFNKLMK